MKNYGLCLVLAATLAALFPAPAAAEPVLLTRAQLVALFAGNVTFSLEAGRGTVTFHFSTDSLWRAETSKNTSAAGVWHIDKRRLCRKETEFSGNWSGLRKKAICFGVKTDGSNLFIGSQNLPMVNVDPAAFARLNLESANTALAASETTDLERERRALEKERLDLERMRIEVEKEKLRQEKASLARGGAGDTVAARMSERQAPEIAFGTYHALIIGINDYESLPDLKTAVTDARAVAQTLETHYGYNIHLLENPTRIDILDKLDELRETLSEKDNLLIYYAGHGWLDPQSGRGYWLPANARSDRRSRWFSNGDLTDALQALFAKHVMVVADSCYSGTLTRSVKVTGRRPDYVARMAEKRTRVVLSSGGLEPVSDAGGGKHSVFARQFLDALRSNEDILDGTQLFEHVRRSVVLNADQTPQYSDIRQAGHEGGDFLFVRQR